MSEGMNEWKQEQRTLTNLTVLQHTAQLQNLMYREVVLSPQQMLVHAPSSAQWHRELHAAYSRMVSASRIYKQKIKTL